MDRLKTNDTLLVLGAGASMDFNYPSGKALLGNIVKSCDELGKRPNKTDQYLVAARRIEEGGYKSIDFYLKENPEHGKLIKPLIVEQILKNERHEHLFKRNLTDLWYQYYFNRLFPTRESIIEGEDVREYPDHPIITFNYDRSLEYFLFKFFSARLPDKAPDQIFEIIYSRFTIQHVYGRMPFLPNEEKAFTRKLGTDHTLKYGAEFEYGSIEPMDKDERLYEVLADNIYTIYEMDSDDVGIGSYKILFAEARRKLILGCGFHKENMQLLALDWQSRGSKENTVATLSGLDHFDDQNVRKNYKRVRFENTLILDFFKSRVDPTG